MTAAQTSYTDNPGAAESFKLPLLLAVSLFASIYLLPMAADAILGLALFYCVAKGSATASAIESATQSGPQNPSRVLIDDPLGRLALALVAFLCLSVLWSDGWRLQDLAQTLMRALLCLCVLTIAANISTRPGSFYPTLGRAITISVVLSALVCIAIWLQNTPEDGRMNGLFRLNNPGKAGRSYAAALPILLFTLMLHKGVWRWLAYIGIGLAATAIILTDTRAAWLGGFIGAATVLLATWCTDKTRFLHLGLIVLAVCAAALGVLALHPDPDIRALLLPRGDSFRLQIWSDHVSYILSEVPIFGGGYLASLEMDLGTSVTTGAHNMYLSVALQIGLVGLALYIAITVWTALRLYHHLQLPVARMALGLLAGGLAVYVFNGDRLLDKVNFIWIVTWLPLAVALSLGNTAAASERPAQ